MQKSLKDLLFNHPRHLKRIAHQSAPGLTATVGLFVGAQEIVRGQKDADLRRENYSLWGIGVWAASRPPADTGTKVIS